ncbi:MAG: hypothetical protein Q8O67_29430 [Deltaproteobacteria bacterium]|nr:hypothetical protein [Deltaproteobacteria bacterium]
MTSTTNNEITSATLVAPHFLKLIERLRTARVARQSLDPRTVDLGVPPDDEPSNVIIDAFNGLVDVDARLSLAAIAASLETRGWLLPLMRPLPATPLWRLAMDAPFVVDAAVQAGILVSVDGDVFGTPRAPRHSAGPSVLHSTTTNPPFAFLTRARLRVAPATHTPWWREDHGDVMSVAKRLRGLVDESRAFGAEGFGTSVVGLGGEAGHAVLIPEGGLSFTRWTSMHARWSSSRSVRPGDVDAIAAALSAGHRVAVVPFLQRAAILGRSRPPVALVDVRSAAGAFADALRSPKISR